MKFLNNIYFSHSTVVSPLYRIYQYNENNYRIACVKFHRDKGFELSYDNDFPSIDDDIDSFLVSDKESLRCSISRSRRKIREYALCNDFEYFVTITINSEKADRFSLTQCQDLLKKKLYYFKSRNENFKYILITEKHLNGAFHFHGLMKGINEGDLILYSEEDFEKLPKYILTNIRKR